MARERLPFHTLNLRVRGALKTMVLRTENFPGKVFMVSCHMFLRIFLISRSWKKILKTVSGFSHQFLRDLVSEVLVLSLPLSSINTRFIKILILKQKRFWPSLNPRTKTTVVSVFQAFASPFLYGELYQRCCTGVSIDPPATHRAKIILMDMPAESSESNLVMQPLMKTCWQLATRRRRLTPHSGLAVCYADEAALYATSGDGPFLAIARNRKATMVYIGHAIPEFAEKIGQNATMNVFSHFRTKIFHATNDPQTAQYAVSLIGETWQRQLTQTRTESHTASGAMNLLWNASLRLLAMYYGFSQGTSESVTDRLAPQVLPHQLATLRTGGKANRFLVDVIIVQSGATWADGRNFLRATLRQDFSHARFSLRSLLGG